MPAAASTELKAQLLSLLRDAVTRALPGIADLDVELDRPKLGAHGDYACAIALQAAKTLRQPPREIAAQVLAALPASSILAKAEIAGAGFINLFLTATARAGVVTRILKDGASYGASAAGQRQKVQVEFVSANPTGPLHVGHGRGAAIGDSISRILESQGWAVSREFYYNDAGAQINNLGLSVQARLRQSSGADANFPTDGYHGEYIVELAERYAAENPADAKGSDLAAITRFAVSELRNEQDRDLRAFEVSFDSYYLESSLYTDGKVQATVDALIAAGHTYEKDGALWLKTTDFGDDKDRVMRKSDGSYTYFVPDVAYHVTKWQRGYQRVINEQGSDHHSTVTRVRAGLQALKLGIPPGYPEYVLHQMVTVMRGGEEVKISKRAGGYVTLRELIDEVGRDATRYFFVMRKSDTHLVFDIDLARSQSEDNPVYYIQYAHARICSVLREWGGDVAQLAGADLAPLGSAHELGLFNELSDFPALLTTAASERAPHLVAFYLKEVAGKFHSYYNAEQFLVTDDKLRFARLALVAATRQVIANGLTLLGVSTPATM
ncbi:MAG: arginine--tRNA ligase [Burkholderiales bacterium]|nr:arginine--tRNA ligase [Burkholderiales bacterium]